MDVVDVDLLTMDVEIYETDVLFEGLSRNADCSRFEISLKLAIFKDFEWAQTRFENKKYKS